MNLQESIRKILKEETEQTNNTYKLYDIITNNRIGGGTPINWYEYINP